MRTIDAKLPRLTLCLAMLSSVLASAQPAKVEIAGELDGSGQNYTWQITNNFSSPIVYVEIPHYHIDTFRPPDGWSQKCTNLSRIGGGQDAPGVLTAAATPPNPGISPRASATFAGRLAKAGANRGTGTVKVQFADGSEFRAQGVPLPTAPSSMEQVGTVGVLGGAFIIFLAVQAARRRKRRAADQLAANVPSQ